MLIGTSADAVVGGKVSGCDVNGTGVGFGVGVGVAVGVGVGVGVCPTVTLVEAARATNGRKMARQERVDESWERGSFNPGSGLSSTMRCGSFLLIADAPLHVRSDRTDRIWDEERD